MVRLGDRVEDMVTGFSGIAVAKSEYLNGCVRYGVQGPLHDGVPTEWQWFDDSQLHVLVEAAVQLSLPLKGEAPGGPRPNPVRNSDGPSG
jgi:hypothetical protein